MEPEKHQVGSVDLVAGGAEVLPDRAQGGAAGGAVFHRVAACGRSGQLPERAWMRSWVLSARLIAPVSVKRTRLWAKTGGCGRAASQIASRRAVT